MKGKEVVKYEGEKGKKLWGEGEKMKKWDKGTLEIG